MATPAGSVTGSAVLFYDPASGKISPGSLTREIGRSGLYRIGGFIFYELNERLKRLRERVVAFSEMLDMSGEVAGAIGTMVKTS